MAPVHIHCVKNIEENKTHHSKPKTFLSWDRKVTRKEKPSLGQFTLFSGCLKCTYSSDRHTTGRAQLSVQGIPVPSGAGNWPQLRTMPELPQNHAYSCSSSISPPTPNCGALICSIMTILISLLLLWLIITTEPEKHHTFTYSSGGQKEESCNFSLSSFWGCMGMGGIFLGTPGLFKRLNFY